MHYTIGDELGKGSFGSVHIGKHAKAHVPCAVKIIKKNKVREFPVYEKLMI